LKATTYTNTQTINSRRIVKFISPSLPSLPFTVINIYINININEHNNNTPLERIIIAIAT
jgi:hypothetical protein